MTLPKSYFYRLTLLFLFLLYAFPSGGKEYYFKHYNTDDGLAHQTVSCSFEDSRGFMWFGTKAGFSRFDGTDFKNFKLSKEDSSSENPSVVNSIVEDSDGMLWLATSAGLYVYNPVLDRSTKVFSDSSSANAGIDQIALDRQGCLWAINSGGISKINLATLDQTYFSAKNYFSPSDILISQTGKIWISSSVGDIYLYDNISGSFNKYKILTDDERESHSRISHIAESEDGTLFISTTSLGIRTLTVNSREVSSLFDRGPDNSPIFIHTILYAGNKELYLGTENGIYIYSLDKGFTEHFYKDYRNKYSLSDNAVHSLSQDSHGGIWAGTFFGGINYLAFDNATFEIYWPTDRNGDPSASVIRQIVPDEKSDLWIGTEDGGLCFLDTYSMKIKVLDGLQWEGQPLSKNIQGLLYEDNSTLWIATFDSGVYVMDTEKGRLIRHYGSLSRNSGLNTDMTVCLYKTHAGALLLGTMSGLFYLDGDKFMEIPAFAGNMIHCIFEDTDGTIWIGCYGQGLYRLNAAGNASFGEPMKINFKSNYINSISRISKGLVIATEDNGVFKLDQLSCDSEPLFDGEDLNDMIIYKVEEDASGTIWISTSKGLMEYGADGILMDRYSTSSGLPVTQFNYNSSYQDKLGYIYMGTVSGLVRFMPDKLKKATVFPKTYLTGVRLYDKELNASQNDSPLKKSIMFTDAITLNHKQNEVSISFVSPSFSSVNNIWYRYRLHGADAGWNVSMGARQVNYANLSPGKYTFAVQASSNPNIWGDEYTSLHIRIKPPFWRSNGAKAAYGILLIFTLLFIVHRAKEQMRRRELNISREKEKELLNEKIDFFTNITHEIRTPLTLISGYTNRIKKSTGVSLEDKHNISLLDKSVQRLHDIVNQLLDFQKLDSSNYYMRFEKTDLRGLLQSLSSLFSSSISERDIDFDISIPDDTVYVTTDKEAMTKIISNMFSNAFKYCQKYVEVKMELFDRKGASYASIRVTNDGDRIPDKHIEDVFKPFYQYKSASGLYLTKGSGLGLSIASSLAKKLNGLFYFDKTIQDYNSFVLEIPVDKEEADMDENIDNDTATSTAKILKENNKKGYTILIVEDDKALAQFISEELSDKYNTIVAGNGKEALDLIEQHNIALIITDLMMPVMDGITFCREVKNNINYCHIPIIVLTAKVSLKAHMEALESKADAFIEKPFSSEHLISQINNLLSNRELLRKTMLNSPYFQLSSVASNANDKKFLERMNGYLNANLTDSSLSVESLAEYMNMSLSTLFRKVKNTTSLSPNEYIKLTKLKKAAELLASSDMNVAEVSDYLGFSSSSYFASCFMKQFGINPKEFVTKSRK